MEYIQGMEKEMKKFRDFESARAFARSLGLKSNKEWRAYRKSGNKPDDIPSNPNATYKNEFKGVGDWLGTGRVADQNKVYRSFEDAREFVRALNLKSTKEWQEYCKSGNKPDDIPTAPNGTYKKDYKGWGDFLGTENIASQDKIFRSFEEAREFVRKLGLKNQKEWLEYCKSGDKPDDIPSNPNATYKKEWKGFGDWTGTGNIAAFNKVYRSFESAREFVRKLGLKNQKEWKEYCKSGDKPDDIPANPNATYKKDFKGMGDWLGTGSIAPQDREYRPYKEAREFVRSLGLKTANEWKEYCNSGNKPDDIPSNPNGTYKKEWKGFGDWIGTGRIADRDKIFRSFEDAREFVRKLGLKSNREWKEYCKSGNKPDDIPSNPWNTYKKWKKK
jgi:adenylate cyclase class IV